jgi:septal ring factor EnvC (AmiA/AmiB activator)
VRQLLIIVALTVGLAGQPSTGLDLPEPAGQDAQVRAEELAARAAARISALQREAQSLAAQERTLLVELRQFEVDRDLKAAEVAKIDADLSVTNAELARAEAESERLEAALARQIPLVRARMVELYKLGRPAYWRLILNVDDVRAIGRAYRDVSALSRLDQERLTELRQTVTALADSQRTLTERRTQERRLRSQAQAARTKLARAVDARQARIDEIDARRDLTARLTGELQLAEQRLEAAVATLAAGGSAVVTLPFGPFRGDLEWPVDGRVAVPFTASRAGRGVERTGIEIDAVEGASVRAVHGGTVAYADAFTGYGNLVILDHGDAAFSLYGYLGSLSVDKGERVDTRTVLGAAGRPPMGGGARVYFEVRIDGGPVNPVEWLKPRN